MDGMKKFCQLPQTDFAITKSDTDLFPDKVYMRVHDTGVKGMKILKQPDATAAMYGRYKQLNPRNTPIRKVKQLTADFFLIEVSIAGACRILLVEANAGGRHHFVIPVQSFFGKYLINHAATVAAEWFIIIYHRVFTAILPAMHTFNHLNFSSGAKVGFIWNVTHRAWGTGHRAWGMGHGAWSKVVPHPDPFVPRPTFRPSSHL
jgi:hypothetical protein